MNININLFDAYEVHPCRLVMQGGTVIARGSLWQPRETKRVAVEINHEHVQHPEHTWFWCLYGHGFSGGLTDLCEAPTQEEVLDVSSYLAEHKLLPLSARRLSPGDFAAVFRYSQFTVQPFKLAKRGGSTVYFRRGTHVRHGVPADVQPCATNDKNLFAYGLYGLLAPGEWLFGRRSDPAVSAIDDRGKAEHLMDFANADDAERAACYVRKHGVLPPIIKWLR